MNDLYEFLSEVQLSQHHQKFVSKLKVASVAQLRDVEDEDLVDIGMSQSEIGRLKLHLRRKLPHGGGGAFGHLKKVHFLVVQLTYGSATVKAMKIATVLKLG